ncbi:MAG: class I mannose-6-phosphate isomerase [Alistipes sp.]|jgi:mannose-6-phosphate isomerase|nr:class I mannose-6-phosphate isomerase [Alistipes sp.]
MLYPLQFSPRLKERLWGSESWEISAVEGDVSVAANGFLKGNSLAELVEVYMGDLVGDKVFARFGEEFPLLIKFIDARERLSVQVHPGDELAAARHNAFGKTEMWVIMSAEPGARLFIGFKPGVTREAYIAAVADGSVGELLNEIPVASGDAFFIPAGTVHAIGEGITLAEVQQTSDITYRIFDWNRVDDAGRPREMHTELALDAIDFAAPVRSVGRRPKAGETAELVASPHFTTNVVDVAGRAEISLAARDSFSIYICTAGEVTLRTAGGEVTLRADSVALIPAEADEIVMEGSATLLETYL